jgi:DNA-binding PadR family transcriptional regulator
MYPRAEIYEDILIYLGNGRMYGLELQKKIEACRDLVIARDDFYQTLKRLRADKMIVMDKNENISGRLRHYYRISEEGRMLAAKIIEKRSKCVEIYAEQCKYYGAMIPNE